MADSQSNIGPGACYAWWNFDLPSMWAMLESEDVTRASEQAVAWNSTYDLLSGHATHLQSLRDTLAERWPPERSEASAIFLDYLDRLIESVHPASFASANNATALSDLIGTLTDAKARVRPLYEQWQANANSGKPDPKAQKMLNDQAASIMYQTDETVYQQGERFVVPPEYEPTSHEVESTTPFLPSTAFGSTAVGGPASSAIPLTSVQAPDASAAPSPDTGAPILSGGVAAPPVQGVILPELPTPQPSSIETPAGAGLVPGLVIGLGMNNALDSFGVGGARFAGSGMSGSTSGLRSSSIGVAESRSLGTANGESVQRSASTVPSGGEAARAPGGMGGMLGGTGSASRRRRLEGGEAYTEWPVAGGGPAVLRPPRESDDHDPGPGVIGIDR